MSRFALFASLMVVSVAAQADFAAPAFKYIGCVEAEPPVFNFKANLSAPFSVQQCQYACHAKGKYAALDGSCNCYDSSSKAEPSYQILDESVCSLPCIGGNRTAGVCGGPQCPVTGKKRYSLYKRKWATMRAMILKKKTRVKGGVWRPSMSPPWSRPSHPALPKSPTVLSLLPRPLHTAQQRVVMSSRHQPSPPNRRVLRSAVLHALLKVARLVLQAAPSGVPSLLLLRHQLQHAMGSTARLPPRRL